MDRFRKPDEEFDLEQMEKETEEMLRMNFLTPDNAKFSRTPGGFVALNTGDKEYKRVSIVRMFPFTDPGHYISVRTPDENSKEIGIIRDMDVFPKDVIDMLVQQMNLRYFTPIITKVVSIKDEYGYAYFDVVTDRGEVRFTINMGGNSVIHLTENRILITDIDENRFEIPDVMALTTAERKKLDLFL